MLLDQLTIKDNVVHVGLFLLLKPLKVSIKLHTDLTNNSQFNKLWIVVHTLVLKDAEVDGHNGLMNILNNTDLS